MSSYCVLWLFTAVLISSYLSNAAVTLTSSPESLCPGGTVLLTCVTDTGKLEWRFAIGSKHVTQYFYRTNQIGILINKSVFTVILHNITGDDNNTFWSTATVSHHVPLNYSENVSCSDCACQGRNITEYTIRVEPPPSPPLNLTFTTSPTLSSVTISWVAPLDTPLCVHSYTVTVRNSCNSSQVKVYNTTDNRSSLSITDLTSDGEYSVTVAGRDGAGRLGQKSEELRISLSVKPLCCKQSRATLFLPEYNTVFGESVKYGVFIKWKAKCYYCFLITHNVSSDQSPITVNRTNVTLYGVQPGETYTVEIIPFLEQNLSLLYSRKEVVSVAIPHKSHAQVCTRPTAKEMQISPGIIMSIVSLAVVVLTTCGYVLLCLLSTPRDNCTKGSDHTTGNIQDTYNVIDSQYTLSSNVAEASI